MLWHLAAAGCINLLTQCWRPAEGARLSVKVERAKVAYKKALDRPFCTLSLLSSDGSQLEPPVRRVTPVLLLFVVALCCAVGPAGCRNSCTAVSCLRHSVHAAVALQAAVARALLSLYRSDIFALFLPTVGHAAGVL
jgi:hypothetical protein